jgi:hypothetical protein
VGGGWLGWGGHAIACPVAGSRAGGEKGVAYFALVV